MPQQDSLRLERSVLTLSFNRLILPKVLVASEFIRLLSFIVNHIVQTRAMSTKMFFKILELKNFRTKPNKTRKNFLQCKTSLNCCKLKLKKLALQRNFCCWPGFLNNDKCLLGEGGTLSLSGHISVNF